MAAVTASQSWAWLPEYEYVDFPTAQLLHTDPFFAPVAALNFPAPQSVQGEPATAELFADFLSYRSPRTDGQQRPDRPAAEVAFQSPREPSGGPIAAQAIYSTADFEDKLDLLRARLPDRSSQELRQLLHQADGEIHAVIAKFQ